MASLTSVKMLLPTMPHSTGRHKASGESKLPVCSCIGTSINSYVNEEIILRWIIMIDFQENAVVPYICSRY